MTDSTAEPRRPGEYVVVARRYRPQTFTDLVGQQQVSLALTSAIQTNRVGHAYLFTGARGVGKTSTARILAKALDCVHGPTPQPCNECDICVGISTGQDVDVLEIDGASNRGIDEIRQLRSNVNVRPSRARFKIYIIDEVHMLTQQAFNALLKTLEEPPEHVKFIFCTTDPEKIPITVLSRCQRFDFPPVSVESIVDRLSFIVQNEGATADAEALRLLARRANGSLRDSQSLLEQLLSFAGNHITVDDVHRMLGTAHGASLTQLVQKLVARDAAGSLQSTEACLREGVDAGQLAEQLLGYYRDLLAARVGCGSDLMLHTTPAEFADLTSIGKTLGLETLLASLQILDQCVARMRQSMHVRTLLEIAIVRLCHLEELAELSQVIAQLQGGVGTAPSPPAARVQASRQSQVSGSGSSPPDPGAVEKKTPEPVKVAEPVSEEPREDAPGLDSLEVQTVAADNSSELTEDSAKEFWLQALDQLDDMAADMARFYDRVAIPAPDRLVVRFRPEYTLQKQSCERPERKTKLEQAMSQVVGRPIHLEFQLLSSDTRPTEKRQPTSRRQRMRELESHPLVQQAKSLFDAEVLDVSESRSRDGE